ncbi:MAG TPA: class I SAM-dependent methyltransferase [Kofleriaceae bacterium]|nr:class I SAM-dependent methyltransferase [Kofleriaceae bacterium]
MSSVYDVIAEDYKKSREQLPFRRYVEEYTYMAAIGDVTGKTILDLACGEGLYSRELKRRGAAKVVGVDLSPAMIAFAHKEEARAPLGIEYVVEDVRKLGRLGDFDLVVASYLLNYSRSSEELAEMCAAIAANLRPGGRFITINNNAEQPVSTFEKISKYGFTKSVHTPALREGSEITIRIRIEDREISFENYYLTNECCEQALRAVGFHSIRWQPFRVSPAGIQEKGEEFWRDFLDHRPILVLEATRGAPPER